MSRPAAQPGRAWPARLGRQILLLPLRWWPWLALGLLVMVIHLWGMPLAMRLALLPAAEKRGPGWMVALYDNRFWEGKPIRVAPESSAQPLTLERSHTSLTAYALFNAPGDGLYDVEMISDDYGVFWIDGRLVFTQDVQASAANQDERTVALAAGPHLLRVDLANLDGKGNFTLGISPHGQGQPVPLAEADLACPDLGNIANWWTLLEEAPRLDLPGMALISLGLALLMLPRAKKRGRAALAAACAVLILPAVLIPGGRPPKEPFNDRGLVAQLQAQRPEFVFIGNSIVESCNDPARMGELLGGRPVANVITYGGFSAFDYIMLKNLVAAAGIKPKAIFFFFRGTLLTQPLERTEGVFAKALEALSHDNEPVLRQVLEGNSSLGGRALDQLKHWLRASGRQEAAREGVSRAALWLTIPPWAAEKAHKRRARLYEEVNDRFDLGRLRGGADDMVAREKAQEEESFDFEARVEDSFLPHIIDICREMGARPIFVRAQERPSANGPLPDDPRLTRYLAQARAWLEARGAGYHDFTGDPELPLSMYAAGDHIAYPGRFSELMLNRMPWAFR